VEEDMKSHFEMVKQFHIAMELPISSISHVGDAFITKRRVRLILEELTEYMEAVDEGDLIKIADALADLEYVVLGSAVEHGIPLDRVFEEVHRSNMSKKGGTLDGGGKYIKPDTYSPVDLSWLLPCGKIKEKDTKEKQALDIKNANGRLGTEREREIFPVVVFYDTPSFNFLWADDYCLLYEGDLVVSERNEKYTVDSLAYGMRSNTSNVLQYYLKKE
jgi:predicted HAD superfamily Cof-like phosphohydrolase